MRVYRHQRVNNTRIYGDSQQKSFPPTYLGIVYMRAYMCVCSHMQTGPWHMHIYMHSINYLNTFLLCHGKATIVVHVSNHNNSTLVVYTPSPTCFPTVLLPLRTLLSSFPQSPFEVVPSRRRGRGVGKRRGGGKMRGGSGWGGNRRQWNWGESKGITACGGEGIGTGRSRRAASGGAWFSSFSAP